MTTLAFVQAVPIVVVLVALLCRVLVLAGILWAQPIFDFITKRGGGWLGGLIKWVTRPLEARVRKFLTHYYNSLMRAYYSNVLPVIIGLNQSAEVTQRLAGTIGDMSEQTWRALWVLNHETIPRKITTALVPVRQQIATVSALAQGVATTLTQVSTEYSNGLRALPWGVPAGLPNRVATFFVTYKRLWDQVWLELSPRVTQLWTQIVPELRARLEALERGTGGGIGQALQALRNRVSALEAQAASIILPRISNLEAAVEALSREVFGGIGTGLLELVARVATIEAWIADVATVAIAELEAGLIQLRLELEQGIETGLEVLRQRFETLETEVFTNIPARIAALELAVRSLVDVSLGDIGAAVLALTQRIVALEQDIQDRILPGFDLIIGRITALETRIENELLPRLTALEGILAPAAFAALVLATMRTVAPNLFCRNVTTTSRALCADDEAFWDALIAGVLIYAIALNPREVAAAGSALTGALGGVIADTVNH